VTFGNSSLGSLDKTSGNLVWLYAADKGLMGFSDWVI